MSCYYLVHLVMKSVFYFKGSLLFLISIQRNQSLGVTLQCSRLNHNANFIAQDFFQFSRFIHNRDNLDIPRNLKFNGKFLQFLNSNLKSKYSNYFARNQTLNQNLKKYSIIWLLDLPLLSFRTLRITRNFSR